MKTESEIHELIDLLTCPGIGDDSISSVIVHTLEWVLT